MNERDTIVKNVLNLIEKRKEELGEGTVHEYSDGAIVNFFKTWDEYYGDTLKKNIKKFGDYPKSKTPLLVFAKRGINIPLKNFSSKKTYIIIRGQINFFFEEGDILELTDLCSIVVEKDVKHGGMVRKDTFVIIIEDND